MSSGLRISVVIPVLDDADELRECLRLLAAQEVAPYEVVVVDNGSTDDSATVAVAGGARVVPEPRRGIPRASATGYDACAGDVLARLDADSRPHPDWTRRIGETLADDTVDAVTGIGLFHDLPWPLRVPVSALYLGAYYLPTWAALGQAPFWGSSMAMRREVWEQARDRVHLDDDVHDDMDLAFAVGPRPSAPDGRGENDVVWARTVFNPWLRADVSSRSVTGTAQWRRRWARGAETVRIGFADAPAWQRWQVRLGR
ncbi:glycosyltransferase family 2 protein [Nocardioides yefusunii]|uniref:4,4'-diaponeurosporenoate glycosyltransferase n=1 Tax=Nocardioides yefusunii TaxID=2500546 RepID=A0ABW1QV86_9ACTN|nr:glycosyltransferase family A protein [Nocardioides yefusunii]